ncbi:histidine kinase [Mariniflexile litorale]|uniref:Histidine kinase n=1 Tax=Mariniflexile litorale TaxID=3045158 RepID=A0AAU7EHX2_9FLAO|nr:histidine kinase [Mariniflexile sp. KMM 9835]MDQ8210133.1 histidine kinase [Mariniflexile sp. KMM 9835]
MKKIILLLLIVIAIPIIVIEDTSKDYDYYGSNYPDLPKDENWEILKNTIFNSGFNQKMILQRHHGPVLISLHDASPKDSALVNRAILKLKTLFPYKKINYFEDFTGVGIGANYDEKNTIVKGYNLGGLESFAINLYFNDSLNINKNLSKKKEIETSIDREFTYLAGYKGEPNFSGLWKPKVYFDFKENTGINTETRIIEFGLIKVLACKNEFLGMLDMYEVYTANEERMDEIRFIFKKLYTPNIFTDFKTYLYKTYPWRYASNFLNKQKTAVLATWLGTSLIIILGLLGFGLLYKKSFKYSYLNYFLPILFFMITVLYGYKLYHFITVPTSFEHWRSYISIHVLFVIIGAFAALFLMLFDKYIIKCDMVFTTQLILKTGFTLLVCLSPLVVVYLLEGHHNSEWHQKMYQINPILLFMFAFTLGRSLLLYLDHFSENLVKQKDVELSKLKELNAQAEVNLLQSQINPHFLYNALNSIASLAQTDGVKTEKMALSLSDLFKYTINRKGEKESTLKDEVEMVKNYLDVEQIRFGDRLNFNIEVDKAIENMKIPMFLIQPLIENAIKHGISKTQNSGCISLIIKKVEDNIVIKVKDNGPDFPDGLVSGYGLQTVYDLLQLSYGGQAELSWQNTPEKQIMITINKMT